MTSLSTIPAEIIAYILPFVLPEDLENFAQCCQAVYKQASREKGNNSPSTLQEHRLSIQKYFVLNDLEDVGPFLRDFAADQRVGRYVREMNFGPLRRDVNVDTWGIQDVLADKNIYDILLEAAKTTKTDELLDTHFCKTKVYESRERREQTNLMVCSNTDAAIVLLLPLLPNLNSLSFCWSLEQYFFNTLDDMRLISQNWRHTVIDLHCMIAPSMRGLSIETPDTSLYPSAQFLWSQRQPWSQRQSCPLNTVKGLKLQRCDILDEFCAYVGWLQGLESFFFRGTIRNPEKYDLTSLFAVLPSRHGETLTKLSFHTYRYVIVSKLVFKELNVLKELDVDWPMLLSNPYVATKDWARRLPQRLEKLTIHDFGDIIADWKASFVLKRYRPVVHDLISHKAAGLVGLKEFSFTAEYGLFYDEESDVDLSGIDEVARGFHSDCLPVGIRFSFEDYEE
ncbi:hypothetical protein BDR22DRAFT_852712 [Usnea florida]